MIRWLLDCDPNRTAWHPLHPWGASSAAAVAGLRDSITGLGRGRGVLCLLDDVAAAAEAEILKVFNAARADRTLIVFMTSSDPAIIQKKGNDYRVGAPQIVPYETSTLTPERAIKYCQLRMDLVRPAPRPPWLSQFPLFPFTDSIIASCLSSAARGWNETGTIDISQLNVKFGDALDRRLAALPDGFDIAAVAEADVPNHLVDLSSMFGREQVA
jgi:hypothetical protein